MLAEPDHLTSDHGPQRMPSRFWWIFLAQASRDAQTRAALRRLELTQVAYLPICNQAIQPRRIANAVHGRPLVGLRRPEEFAASITSEDLGHGLSPLYWVT